MKYFPPTKTFLTRMITGLILSVCLATPTLNQSINSPRTKQDILKISPAKLVEKVGQKIKANPKMTSSVVTAFANSLLEKYGYDYAFEVCEFISRPNGVDSFFEAKKVFQKNLLKLNGSKQPIQFSGVMGGMCSECFAEFPVRKLVKSELHLMIGGKLYPFKRPKNFNLDQMDLMDTTMTKVIRSWDVPD